MGDFQKEWALTAEGNYLIGQMAEAMADGDYCRGIRHAEQCLAVAPNDCYLLSNYALCLLRMQRYEDAYREYRKIFVAPLKEQQRSADYWLDGLTEACGNLGLSSQMRRYGLEALTRADQALCGGAAFSLPQRHPPVFCTSHTHKNVIAYSLFGVNPRYCETLIVNARLCQTIFVAWTCRVYLDETVPEHVCARLSQAGAEIVWMGGVGAKDLPGVTWRFLVADDPQVSRFLVRDADSLLSEREHAAVGQWLESGYWFHHIRDYFTHTELMLAGLWGGCTGVVRDMRAMLGAYVPTHAGTTRFVDQHFLRECLWPTVRQSLLSHDKFFGFHNARPFPPHEPVQLSDSTFHVGSNAAYQQDRVPCGLPDGTLQRVVLEDAEDGRRSYPAPVRHGKWCLDLPFFLIDKYCKKELTLTPVS